MHRSSEIIDDNVDLSQVRVDVVVLHFTGGALPVHHENIVVSGCAQRFDETLSLGIVDNGRAVPGIRRIDQDRSSFCAGSSGGVIAQAHRIEVEIDPKDKWTVKRLTLDLGVRFDYYSDYYPEQHLGASQYTPTRDITFPETDWVSWKDITPRLGAVYDLFGDGKTAVKVTLNKYMLSLGLQGLFGDGMNPMNLRNCLRCAAP